MPSWTTHFALYPRVRTLLLSTLVRGLVRHELMQMSKETSQPNQLAAACSERRLYEEAISPTNLLLVEEWSDAAAMSSYLSSERFRALIGAVKVLGELMDIRISEVTVIEDG